MKPGKVQKEEVKSEEPESPQLINTTPQAKFEFKTAPVTEEEIEEYKVFAIDATTGKPLRYRILVRDMVIQRVLYNMGGSCMELMFQEHRVNVGSLVMITNEMIS